MLIRIILSLSFAATGGKPRISLSSISSLQTILYTKFQLKEFWSDFVGFCIEKGTNPDR